MNDKLEELDVPDEHTVAWYVVQDTLPWKQNLGAINMTPTQEKVLEQAYENGSLNANISEFVDGLDGLDVGRTYVRELLLRITPYELKNRASAASVDELVPLCDVYPIYPPGFECQDCGEVYVQRTEAADHRIETDHEIVRRDR